MHSTFPLNHSTAQNSEMAAITKKWNELNLNSTWIQEDFEDVKFLVKTRLIYSILGFQNSTKQGKKDDLIIKQQTEQYGNRICIRKEGKMIPISQIRKALRWNPSENALVSQCNPLEKWSYLSSQGLVPYNTMYEQHLRDDTCYPQNHSKLKPVAQLSQKEMNRLLTHAHSFSSHSNTVPLEDCAIQFVTHPATRFSQSYLQNLNTQWNVHCGIRLIMADGSVYSFGLGADPYEHRFKKKWYDSLTTVNAHPKNLDYLEFQKYETKLVTTMPLQAKNAESILNVLNLYRERGVRFNLMKQNCVRMATHVLAIAGISLDTRISLASMFIKSLPNGEQIPFIGSSLKVLLKINRKVKWQVSSIIPSIVKPIFARIAIISCYLPEKIATLFLNFGLYCLGATCSSPNLSRPVENNTLPNSLDHFDCLLKGPFDKEAGYVYHSSSFLAWQLQQTTTEAWKYAGIPALNILPPDSPSKKQYSIDKKNELVKHYQ